MNEPFTMPPKPPATQAAEGLPRWHWTVAELERIGDIGTISPPKSSNWSYSVKKPASAPSSGSN